jgi:hypothetical protein
MSNNNTEHPKINIVETSKLELDIKLEIDKGFTIEEATKIVHDNYQKQSIKE